MNETDKAVPLRLKSITLHRVMIPFSEPFRISNGAVSEKEAILVEATTTESVTGWGEASPMSGSFYSTDTPDGAWHALTEKLIPLTLGEEAIHPPDFYRILRREPGESFAKAGLEGALWDVHARKRNRPLCELLSGSPARPIPSGVAIGIYDETPELIARVERYVKQGYRRVKIKIQPGWDVAPVAALRSLFPRLPLMVDANAAYTINDAEVFEALDAYNLMMIEQPLARESHDDAAELQRRIKTPLCADESAESLAALESLIAKRAAQIINIKVQRVGGLSEARLMLERARDAGLACWVGTMPELGIASAQGLHLATHPEFSYPTDIEASARWYPDDVIAPLIEIDADGYIHLLAAVGTGFNAALQKVERYRIARADFVI